MTINCRNRGGSINKKIYKILIILMYILSFLILSYCLKIRLTSGVYLGTRTRLILLAFVCLFIYINGYLLIKKLNYTKKILRINLITYCLIYTIVIFSLTLFDEIYGRRGFVLVKWNSQMFDFYIKHAFNIVPFKTIKLFINGYINGVVSFPALMTNILGNFLAFMPYSLFLPLLFKRMNKFSNFLLTIIIIVIVVEILQFLTLSGSCDIDDLILNVSGSIVSYFFLKIKCIKKLTNKILFYE